MAIRDGFNKAANERGTEAVMRPIKVQVYRFDAPEGTSDDDTVKLDWDPAELVNTQTFASDREFSDAIEFFSSRENTGVTMFCLDGQDLSGMDLSRLSLHAMRIRNCNLTGTNLSGSRFSGSDFSGSDLSGALMTNAIAGALTEQATTGPTYLYPPAVFDGAKLHKADIRNGGFQKVSFVDADMRDTRLDETIFYGSDFSNADLAGASFKEAYINGVNFMKANATGKQLKHADGTPLCQPGHHACAFKRKSRAKRPA